MKYQKSLSHFVGAIVVALCSPVSAAPINFELTGSIYFAEQYNEFNLNSSDLIYAYGSYDSDYVSVEFSDEYGGNVAYASLGGEACELMASDCLTLKLGSQTFHADYDGDFVDGYPRLYEVLDGSYEGLFGIDIMTPYSAYFTIETGLFPGDIWATSYWGYGSTVEGAWSNLKKVHKEVPEPGVVAFLLIGGIGLWLGRKNEA